MIRWREAGDREWDGSGQMAENGEAAQSSAGQWEEYVDKFIETVDINELTGVGGERKIWGAVNLKFPDVPKSARAQVREMGERLVA
jgi:hypothetical protein